MNPVCLVHSNGIVYRVDMNICVHLHLYPLLCRKNCSVLFLFLYLFLLFRTVVVNGVETDCDAAAAVVVKALLRFL